MHLAEKKGIVTSYMRAARDLLFHHFISVCVDDILNIAHVKIDIERKEEFAPL